MTLSPCRYRTQHAMYDMASYDEGQDVANKYDPTNGDDYHWQL
jgi:hypothetical protein